jgi:hypothetical protein
MGAAPDRDTTALARMISVWGAMFFPRDEGKRRDFEDGMLGKAAESLLDRGHWTAAERLDLLELARASPAFDGLRTLPVIRRNDKVKSAAGLARPAVLAGSIAASALIIPLLCNLKYGRADVGLHQAFRAMLGADKKKDPTGFRNLQKVWAQYEPVSHFGRHGRCLTISGATTRMM